MASRIIVHGPLFDGQAAAAVRDWLRVTRGRLADEGRDMLAAFPMDKTGRATGQFQANLRVMTRGQTEIIRGPTIEGVAWAPWLEGTSKRNETTRFKGYHLFRKVRLKLRKMAQPTAQDELDRFIGRMGGHVE